MTTKLALICILASLVTAANINKALFGDPLFISAFNVQVFGKSKMDKPDVVDTLVKIIMRYDLILIQEIRDIDVEAFPELVEEVNVASGGKYGSLLSERTGRTSSKEQYGYIYRLDQLRPIMEYEYNDDFRDLFEREPFVVKFERLTSGGQHTFSFIPLHAKPDDAVNEMNALVSVYDDSVKKTGTHDSVIAGDLNADCSYVCSSCWANVELRQDPRFTWLIPDSVDSTVSSTDCAYDRIITTGAMTGNAREARVFYFDAEYGLSYTQAKDVSDHYPVEFYVN